MKVLFVCGEYYPDILKYLIDGAKRTIKNESKSLKIHSIKIIKVSGIFEIPVTIVRNIKKFDACIVLGCVIKGETSRVDLISKSVTNAIMNLSIEYKKPIGNGIITCFNKDQATKRATKKGKEAVKAVISVLKS